MWCCLCDLVFSIFSRTPTCDDRRIDTDTDTGPWLVPRMDKNQTCTKFSNNFNKYWPISIIFCECWTLSKNDEMRLDTFEMKGLKKILWVSWTAKKTNEWVLNKARVKRELLDTVKARKLAYYGHTIMKQGSCLEKEIMQGTMPGARRRGRPRTAWMDNIKTWTELCVEESIRMTEDRDKWRKYVHGVANPRIEDG